MRRPLLPFLLSLLLLCAPLAGQEIVSISPGVAAIGSSVSVQGGPFAANVRVRLGDREIVPSQIGERQLLFTVPPLAAGDYILSLTTDGQLSPRSLTLRVVEPDPRITAVSPASIDTCSTPAERRLAVSGQSFRPGAQLLLDGAVVAAEIASDSEIVFIAPPLGSGIHQIQVVNPGNRRSLPLALYVNSVPAIDSIEQGADNVVSYELIVQGKNFFYNSMLVVDGTPVNPMQITDPSGSLLVPVGPPHGESVRYVDCNTLVYIRQPYSRQLKRVSVQVVNPGGEQSPLYHVTIP